jgi:hypothetical protein
MNAEQMKKIGWVVLIAAVVLSLVLSINANRVSPAPVAAPAPIVLDSQGVATYRADSPYANTFLQSLGSAQVVGALTANSVAVTNSLIAGKDVSARNITATGTLSVVGTSNLAVLTATSLNASGNIIAGGVITATTGIMINGLVFTMTDPLDVTGILTGVRLLYYQVP